MRESKPSYVDLYEALNQDDVNGGKQTQNLIEKRRCVDAKLRARSPEQRNARNTKAIEGYRAGIEIDRRRIDLWRQRPEDQQSRLEIDRSEASISEALAKISQLEEG